MVDQKAMQERFHALRKQREDIATKAAPVRQRYEAISSQIEALKAQARPVLDELKKIEQPLFDIDQERAVLVRALAGRTGEPG